MTSRFYLLLALVSMLTFSAQAQVSIGASVGANYSVWDWHIKNINTDLDFGPGFGYRAALVADWQISPVIGLRADLAYQIWRNSSTQTFTFPTDPEGVEGNRSERFHNFAGSLLATVSPFSQKRIYFLAGATAASVTEAWGTVTIDGGPEAGTREPARIDLENFNQSQVFADFGAGVRWPLGAKGTLLTEVRYQLALTNLSEHPNVDASVNALLLNVGYLFQL